MKGSLANKLQLSMVDKIEREQGYVQTMGVSDYEWAFLIMCVSE